MMPSVIKDGMYRVVVRPYMEYHVCANGKEGEEESKSRRERDGHFQSRPTRQAKNKFRYVRYTHSPLYSYNILTGDMEDVIEL